MSMWYDGWYYGYGVGSFQWHDDNDTTNVDAVVDIVVVVVVVYDDDVFVVVA